MNILEQYSQTVEKDLINLDKLIKKPARLTNKTSLIQYICGTFNTQFSSIIKSSLCFEEIGMFSIFGDRNSSLKIFISIYGKLFIRSHNHLCQWYKEIN